MTGSPYSNLRHLEAVAKGIDALAASGRLQEAIQERTQYIQRLREADVGARPLLAANLFKQAVSLHRAGQTDAALDLLRDVTDNYSDVSVPGKRSLAADAHYLICRYNFKAGRYQTAVGAADTFVAQHLHDNGVADRVADALVTKGRCFLPARLDRPDLALEAFDIVITEFGSSERSVVRKQVALAMHDKAALLRTSGMHDEAAKLWGIVFDDFKADLSGETLPFLAQAARIESLADAGLVQAACEAAQTLADCLDVTGEESWLLPEIARSVLRAGNAIGRAGMLREALALFTDVANRLATEQDAELQTLGVYAQIDAGVMLVRVGNLAEAIDRTESVVGVGEPALAALDNILKRAATPESDLPREREPWAVLMKGFILRDLGRSSEARLSFAEVIDRFGRDESPTIRLLVEAASDASAALSADER